MTPSYDDLNRSLGRVEGEVLAMKDRMDRLEAFIEETFREFRAALDRIEKKQDAQDAIENQRKGAFAVLWPIITAISAAVSIAATWLINHFFK